MKKILFFCFISLIHTTQAQSFTDIKVLGDSQENFEKKGGPSSSPFQCGFDQDPGTSGMRV